MSCAASRRQLLLVGWDSADWKIIQPLLDRGALPVLESIINQGVMGSLASVPPMLSPMLWNSIATGKRPFKHGVHGFTEVDYELNTIVPVSSASRKCKAVWDILNEAGLRTHVIGWFATHPAEQLAGICVSDQITAPAPNPGAPWPLAKGAVQPPNLEKIIADLRIRPEEVPGEALRLFVPEAARVNQRFDKRLHQLAIHLAECFSVHAAATYALEHEPWDFAAIYYRAIDWICHHFMEFHPPRRASVFDADFELYREVVNGAYRLHDLLLGRLLELSGENTAVILVSDHGFKSGDDRPRVTPDVPLGIAAWHRAHGVFAARGDGIRQDELIHGASILDVTPTILAFFDQAIGSDMDGRVLMEIFAQPLEVKRVPSWDETAFRRAVPSHVRDAEEAASLIKQFVEIGYIEDPANNPAEAIRSTERENRWALAQSYLQGARFADALPLLETVFAEWPERRDYCLELALCQFNLNLLKETEDTLNTLPDADSAPASLLLRANICLRRRQREDAARLISRVEAIDPKIVALQNQIGVARLHLRDRRSASAAFVKAIALDEEDPYAHAGLARCQLRERQFEIAAQSALRALALRFDLPMAHYTLGLALAHLRENAPAIQAFEAVLRYRPDFLPAHRLLAFLFVRGGIMERAEVHRKFAREGRERHAAAEKFKMRLRYEAAARASARAIQRDRTRANSPQSTREVLANSVPLEFVIVSGLPRSGTSLMMQILEAGGLPIMRDDLRPADESNPRGYFEWEEIKQLPKNPYVIEKAQGRVTKVISMLLPSLPRKHRFRIIFMQRDIGEVAASQQKLRQRLSGAEGAAPSRETLQHHRDRMLEMLREAENVDVLEIDYSQLLDSPNELLQQVIRFAQLDTSAWTRMRAVIDPQLRHFATESVAAAD